MHEKKTLVLGYTLVELLITLAMVAILSLTAMFHYREYVQRTARMEAKSVLLQAQNWMEQQFTLNNSYLNAGQEPVLPTSLSKSPISGTEKYRTGANRSMWHVDLGSNRIAWCKRYAYSNC